MNIGSRILVVASLLLSVPSLAVADIFTTMLKVAPSYTEINSVSLLVKGTEADNPLTRYSNPFTNGEVLVSYPDEYSTLFTYQSKWGDSIVPTGSDFMLPIGLDTGSPMLSVGALDLYYTGSMDGVDDVSTHVPVFSVEFLDPLVRGSETSVVVLVNDYPLQFLVLGSVLAFNQIVGTQMVAAALNEELASLIDIGVLVTTPVTGAEFLDPSKPPVDISRFNMVQIAGAPLSLGPGDSFVFAIVPEPGALAMLIGIGAATLNLMRRNRRR